MKKQYIAPRIHIVTFGTLPTMTLSHGTGNGSNDNGGGTWGGLQPGNGSDTTVTPQV
ncbi:hypothetical protein [Bifidobacterium parmae]|uniref:Uncharacterized protein n=1 Tax=Bifidobacterium parmae TaxID=361854 RepID=A0A2N5J0I7_9BIFI|nr:hypothetical protein [Bifidobacterium parmae]PLS27714.1 hypothetical protein Uis4E_1400 [Bifidobacterium parmae]